MNKGFNTLLGAVIGLIAILLAIAGIIGIFSGSFPYDSWDAALEAAAASADAGLAALGGTAGYYTWGPGDNLGSAGLSIFAIAMSIASALLVTTREDAKLNEAAERLSAKYNS